MNAARLVITPFPRSLARTSPDRGNFSAMSLPQFNLDPWNDVGDVIDPYSSDGSGALVQASDSAIAGSAAQRRFINSA